MDQIVSDFTDNAVEIIRNQGATINSQKRKIAQLKADLKGSEVRYKISEHFKKHYKDLHENDRKAMDLLLTSLEKKEEVIKKIKQSAAEEREAYDSMIEMLIASTDFKTIEELENDRKEVELLRKANVEMMKLQKKTETEKKGEPFPWQICEICVQPFSVENEYTPRIMECGHTMCLGCLRKCQSEDVVKCPFDRIIMQLKGQSVEQMPKNFLVLDMCS